MLIELVQEKILSKKSKDFSWQIDFGGLRRKAAFLISHNLQLSKYSDNINIFKMSEQDEHTRLHNSGSVRNSPQRLVNSSSLSLRRLKRRSKILMFSALTVVLLFISGRVYAHFLMNSSESDNNILVYDGKRNYFYFFDFSVD
jgi:hypothetical protein